MTQETQGLRIALPSGKSMEEPTLALFAAAHISVRRPHPRMCTAGISGLPGIAQAVFLKPSEIPGLVADGKFASIGITGQDAVQESGAQVQILAKLSYSRVSAHGTKCVLFTKDDNPVRSIKELASGAVVVSEYPQETQQFLKRFGVSMQVVPCSGSAEALVVVGKYRYGVALTETGTSLRVNGLKEVETVFTSQMALIAHNGLWKEGIGQADFLGRLLQGVLDARDKVYLVMNAPSEAGSKICEVLPAMKKPTIQPLADPGFSSIASIVATSELNTLKMRLAALGATGFVTLPPSTIM